MRVAEQCVCDPYVTLWAVSRCGKVIDAWSVFEHAHRIGSAASLNRFEALPMECELGARYEHKIALLKGLEYAAGNVGEQRRCGAAAERDVAAM